MGDRAFDLLLVLARARGTVLSKDQLMEEVWQGRIVEENTLEVQMSTLRRALGNDRAAIRTVVGRGYQFVGIVSDDPAKLPAEAASARLPAAGIRPPASISRIIGREREVRDVNALATNHRLVTLVGSGGVGKTRLAIAVAHHLSADFAEGAYMAELATTASAAFLPATLAVALGFAPGDGTPSLDRMAATLSARHMLLLLDNCEHLVESVARIAEVLLSVAPSATILATSREPLRLPGEFVYRVPSLDVPPDEGDCDPRGFGAVQLLQSRGGGDDAVMSPLIQARICRRLDGIPLAIELAAACVPLVGLQGVADRLDDRFRLLTRGARTALPRQQTLRATLDWSYELLSEEQRIVLQRLSVFVGPFTLLAAQAMVGNLPISSDLVVEIVFQLVEKSLLSVVPGASEPAYRLLESTRAYAWEKLAAEGALGECSSLHARYFLEVFRQSEEIAGRRQDGDWSSAFAPYLADLRVAVEWGFSPEGESDIAIDLTVASIPLSMQLALLEETLVRVDKALARLERTPELHGGERGMKLYAARGVCLLCQTVEPHTQAAFQNALGLAETAGNRAYQLLGLWGWWMCLYLNGRYTEALPLAERFDVAAAASEWPCDRLAADRMMGISHLLLGRLDKALPYLAHAAGPSAKLPRAQRIRFLYDERTLSHVSLAHTLWFLGHSDQAVLAAQQARADAQELDHPVSLCYALSEGVCTLALLTGDEAASQEAIRALVVETRRHGITTWKARAEMWGGLLDLWLGDETAFDLRIKPAFANIGSKKWYVSLTPFLSTVASSLAHRGRTLEAHDFINPALEWATAMGDTSCLPELRRAKAEILLCEGSRSAILRAEEMLEAARAQAREARYLSWELRCATTLATLKVHRGAAQDVQSLLSPILDRFSEGRETKDVRTAYELLESHVAVA